MFLFEHPLFYSTLQGYAFTQLVALSAVSTAVITDAKI